MIFRRGHLIVLLLLLLLVACQAAGQEEGFGNDDKAEIVQLTLEKALVDQEIPDYTLLTAGGDELILSSENIEDVEIEDVPGIDLVVLSREEIQAKADAEGDFLYLFFNPFEEESVDRINVGFGSQWAVAQDSTTGYLSGGGLQMVYERQPEGWVGEVVAMWIS
jgi:hypothetical protein